MAAIIRVRNPDGSMTEIPALKGDPGPAYVLTDADKSHIATEVLDATDVHFYANLSTAIADINNGVTDNALSALEQGKVKVFTDSNGATTVMLLDDVAEATQIDVNKDIHLVLAGHTLSFTQSLDSLVFGADTDCVIDGTVAGSAIYKNIQATANSTIIKSNGKKLTIHGGEYTFTGTTTKTFTAIRLKTGLLEMCDAKVVCSAPASSYRIRAVYLDGIAVFKNCSITADGTGAAIGILVSTGGFTLTDSTVVTSATENTTGNAICLDILDPTGYGTNTPMKVERCELKATGKSVAYGIRDGSKVSQRYITDSFIFADASGGHVDVAYGIGIRNSGALFCKDTNVTGTHSGISNHGALYVSGGTFMGSTHGGFYLCHGADGIAYIRDAISRCGEYTGQFADFWESGNERLGALYVGGGTGANNGNVTAFLDGCVLNDTYNGTDKGAWHCLVLRGTDGETGHNINISNSQVTGYIRVDNDTMKLNVGVGTNITASTLAGSSADYTEFTDKLYRKHHESEILNGKDFATQSAQTALPTWEAGSFTFDPDCHADYFQVTEDGVVSLKPEYRGASTRTACADAISDMGSGVAGSKNAELPKYLVIPEIVDGVMVDSLASGIFSQNRAIEQVVLPSTISVLPAYCFDQCWYLKDVYNTEKVTVLGQACFQATAIKRANFPNLQTMETSHQFYCCGRLVYADIGSASAIPKMAFERCTALNGVKNSGTITSVGDRAFNDTFNLKKANFMGDLTSIGQYAFYSSKIDYAWDTLTGCAFGTNATPLQLNPNDFWSACTFTPCSNPTPTHFSQYNPLWADRVIGKSGVKYADGCTLLGIMHIYCGLNNLTLSSVTEFEDIVNAIDPTLLDGFAGYMTVATNIMTALGLNATNYTQYNQTTLQAVYDALANGGYVLTTTGTTTKVTGHSLVICGIDANGELIVIDSANSTYDDRGTIIPKYSLHYKKFCSPTDYGTGSGFVIVTP